MNTRSLLLLLLATMQQAQATEPVFARVEAGPKLELGLQTDGMVEQVHVGLWQHVEAGETLLQLDSRPFRARLEAAESRLKRLQLADEEAEREYQRQQELFERMSIARRDLLLAEIERESARARLLEAQAEAELRRLELEYSRLQAPCSGIVTAVHAHRGQAVVNRMHVQPLLELTCTQPWQARAMLSEEQRRALQVGRHYVSRNGVKLRLLGIHPWPDPEDPGKRHPARFEIIDPADQALQPGKRLEIIP